MTATPSATRFALLFSESEVYGPSTAVHVDADAVEAFAREFDRRPIELVVRSASYRALPSATRRAVLDRLRVIEVRRGRRRRDLR